MVQETWVQSQVASYFKIWYLIPPCLTQSNIRYVSRVKWNNPRKGVVLSLHLSVVAIKKGAFWSPLTKVANFSFYFIFEWFTFHELFDCKNYASVNKTNLLTKKIKNIFHRTWHIYSYSKVKEKKKIVIYVNIDSELLNLVLYLSLVLFYIHTEKKFYLF